MEGLTKGKSFFRLRYNTSTINNMLYWLSLFSGWPVFVIKLQPAVD